MKLIDVPIKAKIYNWTINRPIKKVYSWEDWGKPALTPLDHLITATFHFACPKCDDYYSLIFHYNYDGKPPYIVPCHKCHRKLLVGLP